MDKIVYSYRKYKSYLKAYLASQPKNGHGIKALWASHLGCQSAYISRVLNQDAHLSLEQADALAGLLNLSEDESRFFLLLVQHERAGTHSLKTRIKEQINEYLKKREVLRNRVDIKERLPEKVQVKYYSSWHYAAIHMAITISKLRTKQALSKHFKLSVNRVTEVLDFLESVGLVKLSGQNYSVGQSRIFLGSDSDLISKHHMNWRVKAMSQLETIDDESVHLSTVLTFSKSDLNSAKEEILKCIEKVRKITKDTKSEEEIVCFNVDYFNI